MRKFLSSLAVSGLLFTALTLECASAPRQQGTRRKECLDCLQPGEVQNLLIRLEHAATSPNWPASRLGKWGIGFR